MTLIPELPHDTTETAFPALHADVFVSSDTDFGVPFLFEPGVVLLSKPQTDLTEAVEGFLDGFSVNLDFHHSRHDPTKLPDSEALCKFAGQLCYLSFGPGRTPNDRAEQYFRNILESGHGSVLEHAQFSFLFYGISRSLTHELVRHRAGFAYSQVSQRYVDGKKLRFVCRPEFADDPEELELFKDRIEEAAQEYERIAGALQAKQEKKLEAAAAMGVKLPYSKADLRKRVNQVARACLPNETEAPIVASANGRAWRHFLGMRGSLAAETEIRRLAVKVYKVLAGPQVAPLLVQDIAIDRTPEGEEYLTVGYPKV